MIELKLINKSYGNQKILDKISLNIKKGEFISIVGPSRTNVFWKRIV